MAKHENQAPNKKRGTKAALAASFAALLLCGATLVGTTFAWFTDTASTGSNKIVAGNLDVALEMWDATAANEDGTQGKWIDISENKTPIFGSGSIAQDNNAETLWEPGKTQVAYLRIVNKGNLDLQYDVELNTIDPEGDMLNAMQYQILQNVNGEKEQLDARADVPANNWTEITQVGLTKVSGTETGKLVSKNSTATKDSKGQTTANKHYFALAINMEEAAGNQYMGKEVAFDLRVNATQWDNEHDSFGYDYDKQAASEENWVKLPIAVKKDLTGQTIQSVSMSYSSSNLETPVPATPAVLYKITCPDDETTVNDRPYSNWNVDWVISSNKPLTPNDGYLVGHYSKYCQQYTDDYYVSLKDTLPANTEIRILNGLMGIEEFGNGSYEYLAQGVPYNMLPTMIGDFTCGVVDTTTPGSDANGAVLTVKLVMYETVWKEALNSNNELSEGWSETGVSHVIQEFTYTFGSSSN